MASLLGSIVKDPVGHPKGPERASALHTPPASLLRSQAVLAMTTVDEGVRGATEDSVFCGIALVALDH